MVVVLLADRYRLGNKIAVGGMGAVYEATDERLDREVAVKLLKEGLATDPRFVERFRREARAAAALMHPNIAAVYDYGVDHDRHFIVMELVRGRDLARLLNEEGRLEPARAAAIGAQIASALSHAHKAGVIHRDVKPGNVIVSDGDRVKVTDFGIARAVGDSTLTATGTLLGTAHYISPEQAAGRPAEPASDIYAAGIVVFEMLTGAPPFTGDSPIAIAMKHASGELPAPSFVNPGVPVAFDSVIARATEKDPGDRFADAEDFGQALTAAAMPTATIETDQATATAESLQTVWPIPGDRWHPEKVGRAVVVVFIVLAVVAAGLLMFRLTHNKSTDRHPGPAGKAQAASKHTQSSTGTPAAPLTASVPTDIAGVPFESADARLRDLGLKAERHDVPNGEVHPGYVIYTDPAPGTALPLGTPVTVFVSSGEEHGHPPHVPPGHEKKHKEHD
ncbi:MAG: eukaryotic-like serine/threonine-protein kinase [Actinomycetota bacterium]|nr:eukaryotic-like serine/threonine-protein kinase [Actinomycetota bacterium]